MEPMMGQPLDKLPMACIMETMEGHGGQSYAAAPGSSLAPVDAGTREELLADLLPSLDNPRKTDFIHYRIVNFPFKAACDLAGVRMGTVLRWRETDPVFGALESRMVELRKELAPKLMSAEEERNYFMSLRLDGRILEKALCHPSALTDREFVLLKQALARYNSNTHLLAARAFGTARDTGLPVDWSELVLKLTRIEHRETLEVSVERGNGGADAVHAEAQDIVPGPEPVARDAKAADGRKAQPEKGASAGVGKAKE